MAINVFYLSKITCLIYFDQNHLSASLLLSQADCTINYFLVVFLKKERETVTGWHVGWACLFSECFCGGETKGRTKSSKRQGRK